MSDVDNFLKRAEDLNLKLKVSKVSGTAASVDTLFHTPLISLAILMNCFCLEKGFLVSEVSTRTGAALSQSFSGLKQANRKLEWSLTLRKRCADALVFLETMGLVEVSAEPRIVTITTEGKTFVRKGMAQATEYGLLVRGLRRAILTNEMKGSSL